MGRTEEEQSNVSTDTPTPSEMREHVQEVQWELVNGFTARPLTVPDIKGRDVSGAGR